MDDHTKASESFKILKYGVQIWNGGVAKVQRENRKGPENGKVAPPGKLFSNWTIVLLKNDAFLLLIGQ